MKQCKKLEKHNISARANSEAFDNIYSLFKQNTVKSCDAKRRRQRQRVKNNRRSKAKGTPGAKGIGPRVKFIILKIFTESKSS